MGIFEHIGQFSGGKRLQERIDTCSYTAFRTFLSSIKFSLYSNSTNLWDSDSCTLGLESQDDRYIDPLFYCIREIDDGYTSNVSRNLVRKKTVDTCTGSSSHIDPPHSSTRRIFYYTGHHQDHTKSFSFIRFVSFSTVFKLKLTRHRLSHWSPQCPAGQPSSQFLPETPGGHLHSPVTESQVAPLRQSHSFTQFTPHWLTGHFWLQRTPVYPASQAHPSRSAEHAWLRHLSQVRLHSSPKNPGAHLSIRIPVKSCSLPPS